MHTERRERLPARSHIMMTPMMSTASLGKMRQFTGTHTHTHTHTHKIQFHFIYMAPKRYNCLKALYRAQGLNPLRESTMATESRRQLPVNQEETLWQKGEEKGSGLWHKGEENGSDLGHINKMKLN